MSQEKITFLPLEKVKLPSHHDFVVFAKEKKKKLQKHFAPYQIGERGSMANKTNRTKKKEDSVQIKTAT